MHRAKVNYFVDVLTFALILAMTATGLILRFVLPPGSGGLVLGQWTRHDWGDMHFWFAAGLGVIIVLHVALHWAWVCGLTHRLLSSNPSRHPTSAVKRNLAGLAFLGGITVVLAGLTWWASQMVSDGPLTHRGQSGNRASVERALEEHEPASGQHTDDLQIRGSMTLEQVAQSANISVELLRDRLGLPPSVAADTRLGHLRREYGFRMSDVRQAAHAPPANANVEKERTP